MGYKIKMKIVVGSENPTKIHAAKMAFMKAFPNEPLEVVGVKVSSGVPDQPQGQNQTIEGAINRAKRALEQTPDADFGVGEEGGMQPFDFVYTGSVQNKEKWFETGWCVVIDTKGLIGIGSSIHMEVPPKLMKHVSEGKELGTATDIAFATVESGKQAGFFGLMTNNHIDRTSAYADGILAALTRFLHPRLY